MKKATVPIIAVLLILIARLASAAGDYVVIVNKTSSIAKLKRREVAQIFLKKTAKVNGVDVVPVDLPQTSAVRAEFTKVLLEKSVSSINAYWQQQIFSGKSVPPAELSEDDAVAFVRANAGAISYVSPQKVSAGVKQVEVTD